MVLQLALRERSRHSLKEGSFIGPFSLLVFLYHMNFRTVLQVLLGPFLP